MHNGCTAMTIQIPRQEVVDFNGESVASIDAQRPFNKRMLIMKRCVALKMCSPKEFGRTSNERYINEASAARSGLNALRKIYQPKINKEIETLLNKYAEKYFKPAVTNICSNINGMTADSLLHSLCQNVLEEAKNLYPADRPDNTLKKKRKIRPPNRSMYSYAPKSPTQRRDNVVGADADLPFSKYNEENILAFEDVALDEQISPIKRSKSTIICEMIDTETLAKKWDPSRVTEQSLFVLGPQANSALGFATQRGRIYTKYPWLFKYMGDNDDRQWLIDQNLKRGKNGGKVFFILFDDIMELASSSYCSDNTDVDLSRLVPFTLPQVILSKVRKAMVDLFHEVTTSCEKTEDGGMKIVSK